MSAGPYLKNAAAQVKSAISDLQQQIKQLEGEFDAERRNIERNIKDNQKKITAEAVHVMASNNSDINVPVEHHIKDLKNEIDQHGQHIQNKRSEIQQAIGARNALLSQLQGLDGRLDNMASSAGAQ